MKAALKVVDLRGTREYPGDEGPWSLGGSDADIVVSEAERALVAYIGCSEGNFFVQAADRDADCRHNGLRIQGSVWLQKGDRLSLQGKQLQCNLSRGTLTVSLEDGSQVPEALTPPRRRPDRTAIPGGETPSRAIWKRATMAALALLTIVALFVLFARPVTLRITPMPDHYSLSGFPPAVPFGRRYLALPGHYRVHAELARYQDLNQPISVTRSGDGVFDLDMQKLPGRITVLTQPSQHVIVFVDDQRIGTTPMGRFKVAAGRHRFRFTAPRYLSKEMEVDVVGLDQAQQVSVQLAPGWGDVSVVSTPPQASIRVDGVEVGKTPQSVEIMAGEHTMVIALDGYLPLQQTLRVSAGETLQLPKFTLREPPGMLAVVTRPAGATVTRDGEYVGRSPVVTELLPRTHHRLRVDLAGYQPVVRNITLLPGDKRKLELSLQAQYGVVFVTSDPADAKLFVDGKAHGLATQRLRLTAREHSLRVEKEGYAPFSTTVKARPAISKQIVARLKSLAQIKQESIKPILVTRAGQRLRLIHPGRFDMGASRRDPGRRSNETLHPVQLTRPYYLSEKLVTNAEFRQFDGKHLSGNAAGVSLNGPRRPVVKVSWGAAVRYLNWLSKQDELPEAYVLRGGEMHPVTPPNTGYRLPTEAEWAFAARKAGRAAEVRFEWGAKFPPKANSGNFADSSASHVLPAVLESYNDGAAATSPVGKFKANPAGFFDFAGNAAEWCQDYYAIFPFANNKVVLDPLGPATGKHHVVRGSSWRSSTISQLRLSFRDYRSEASDEVGFRIARYLE